MRTLKKTLCLVLALVMVLGLCAFNVSAAEFTDTAAIEYKEAVGVMQAAKVLAGFEDGSFRPDGTLTRAQAAKMIACMMGFGDLKGTSNFTDCKGHWADSYIAFCAKENIVAGYGDGTFGPEDTLTGSQWAKMVICAIGYNAAAEGISGADWEIAVAKKVKSLGLADNIAGFDGTKKISREQACEMGFQGMQANMVKYTPGITVNGVEIPGTTATISPATNLLKGLGIVADETAGQKDAFGRPISHTWKDNNIKTGDKTVYKAAQSALATIDGSTLALTVGKLAYLKGVTSLTVYTNGKSATVAAADYATTLGKAGLQIEFYGADADAKVASTAVAYSYAPYTVSKIAKNGDITLTALNDDFSTLSVKAPGAGAKESADYTAVKGFALKDVLAVCVNADTSATSKILNVAKAGTVGGKATAATKKGSDVTGVTVDGTKYALSYTYAAEDTLDVRSEGTMYLDPNGTVITFVGKSEENSNYIYVVDTYTSAEAGQYGNVNTYFVLGVDVNGSQVTYQVADTTKLAKFTKGAIANLAPDTDPYCSGKYINADAQAGAVVKTDSVTLGTKLEATAKTVKTNHYFASDVKFIYVTGGLSAGVSTVRVTVRSGVQEVAASQKLLYVLKDVTGGGSNKLVPVVFVPADAGYDTTNGVAFAKEAFDSSDYEYKQNKDGQEVLAWAKTIYIDGESTKVWVENKAALDGFYSVAKNGDLTVLGTLTASNLVHNNTVTSVFNGNMTTSGTDAVTDKTIASDVQIISLVFNTDTFTYDEFALNELQPTEENEVGATVSLVLDKTGKTITTIYVTRAPYVPAAPEPTPGD